MRSQATGESSILYRGSAKPTRHRGNGHLSNVPLEWIRAPGTWGTRRVHVACRDHLRSAVECRSCESPQGSAMYPVTLSKKGRSAVGPVEVGCSQWGVDPT